jgi:N-acetylglucosamine-6-phosphate deacetylase
MEGPVQATLIIHGARKLDAEGLIDDFWFAATGDTIVATGDGLGWREHAEASAERAEIVDAAGRWLTPGFIDLHCHGGGGFAFENGTDAIIGGLGTQRSHGTTRSVVSLVANPIPELELSLRQIADLVERDPLVLGSHLEGPFMSTDRRGAHNPDYILDPDPETVERLIGASRNTLRQITIAPELPGALEAIDVLVEAGVEVAVGHTDASYEQALAAFRRGARILTHGFNAMPGIHHRKPGPLIAAFETDNVTVEIIGDALHVVPPVMHLAFTEAAGRVALVTDAMAAAGAGDGDYELGSLNVTVKNGLATIVGTDTIAASTLTLDAAVRIAIELTGIEPRIAVEAATLTPAKALGLGHALGLVKAGYAADAVLLDHGWSVQRVWGAGDSIV